MTLRRAESGEVSTRVNVYRNGQLVTNANGASDLSEFVRGIEISSGSNKIDLVHIFSRPFMRLDANLLKSNKTVLILL